MVSLFETSESQSNDSRMLASNLLDRLRNCGLANDSDCHYRSGAVVFPVLRYYAVPARQFRSAT